MLQKNFQGFQYLIISMLEKNVLVIQFTQDHQTLNVMVGLTHHLRNAGQNV